MGALSGAMGYHPRPERIPEVIINMIYKVISTDLFKEIVVGVTLQFIP